MGHTAPDPRLLAFLNSDILLFSCCCFRGCCCCALCRQLSGTMFVYVCVRPVDWYLNFDLWKVATSSSEIEEEKRCTCLFTKWESNRMVTSGTLAGQPQPSYYQLSWDPSHVRHCLCATTKTRANVPAQRPPENTLCILAALSSFFWLYCSHLSSRCLLCVSHH